MEESLDALNTERQKITRELGRAEGLIESARNNNVGNAKTLEAARSVELEEEKINLKEADLKSEMWGSNKNYEEFCDTMLPNFAIADFSNDLENKIIKLRREISEIGNIDEETLREYEETNRRHEFLTKEFSDLERAVWSLKNLIGDLAERIGGDFEVGLIKINEEFDRYFKSMFGGGSAKLAIETAEETDYAQSIDNGNCQCSLWRYYGR